ncbi:uncharacterized protein LOC26530250 [Drosophila willistoni]|uniref:uncharacterized protein LOC26530250 n=1 Tax=Drosophila willistoni TaxID=7260 RepID=UPI000C26D92E|nr:uncharacterized protein LOC26530250 [Drosophila willistoni]
MISSFRIMLIFTIFTTSVKGQCVDCNKHWQVFCQSNYTGYFCEKGAKVTEKYLTKDEYSTSTIGTAMFDQCTPYPYFLDYAKTFCCFYSPSVGCQVAINPTLYRYEAYPNRFCSQCEKYCRCNEPSPNKGYSIKSWTRRRLLDSLTKLILTLTINFIVQSHQ